MFNNNSSIAINVSDEDSDNHAEKLRLRARRKRKKSAPRGTAKLLTRFLRRWWPVFLFFPAAGLLVFEASTLGLKHSPLINSELATQKTHDLVTEKKSGGNLNRLDPTTRVVAGVRERCLKLLPEEELQQLDIPIKKEFVDPIKKLIYISESDTPDGIQSRQRMDTTRFNLFTGNQSFEQREHSFKIVNEMSRIHCGFYSKDGGFLVSDDDKSFMQTCKVVVSTCTFGGGDDLYQPIGMSESSLQKVCYVAFWDEITLAAQEVAGHKVGEDHYIGKWRIVLVRNLPFSDQRLNGKIPKMLAHRLFPQSSFSIWVDSKSQFRRDPLGVLEALLWRSNSVLAISEHGARSSVYDEAKAVVKKNKATPEEVEIQLSQYRLDGLPEDKRFNGKKALSEASVIVREHTPITNLFMCLWFNEVVRFTSRDQLSFPYVLWRLKVLKNINMFPVCTRKDLVNSMGHIRKAKPLVT
ncbi:Forkhead box protein like [Heracleum sosnowskyi]|uniref:Forkhead box protein like n=1 Tax=Heracleum sosnowskyi TaxID=360622 RepID=A0AAD8IRY9_9APIA|nr:Forkhead box protein like [Heracleum sosnowskyi]